MSQTLDARNSPFTNNQWRRSGMTNNGLRDSTNVINYFYTPGRSNLLADPNPAADITTLNPSLKVPISSIGRVQYNPLKDVAASTYGPGTLLSSNIQITNPNNHSDAHIGYVRQNEKRSIFVDYRRTDPILVDQLRKNPLSIYAVGNRKNDEIPSFFAFTKPEDRGTYKNVPFTDIDPFTKELTIDGSPNVSVLDLAHENPFMGLTNVVNDTPDFTGKTYGGTDGSAKYYAETLYNQGWNGNNSSGMELVDKRENFGGERRCTNKALMEFAQGYNIANQIGSDTFIEQIGEGRHTQSNLPWGPKRVTGNPNTQQGGLWNGQNDRVSVGDGFRQIGGYSSKKVDIPQNRTNPYRYGLPGSLISN